MRCARASRTSVIRHTTAALLVSVLAVAAAGCLTADGTMQRDGTGTLALSFKAPPGANEAAVREMLTAPGVTVESLSLSGDQTVSATLKVSDPAGIGKTKLLKDVTVTKASEGEDETLTIAGKNPSGRTLKDKSLPGPKVKLTLPGTAIEANEGGVVSGNTVAWSFTLVDWLSRPDWQLRVRYRPAGATTTTSPSGATPQ
jgi:hypothetical protein